LEKVIYLIIGIIIFVILIIKLTFSGKETVNEKIVVKRIPRSIWKQQIKRIVLFRGIPIILVLITLISYLIVNLLNIDMFNSNDLFSNHYFWVMFSILFLGLIFLRLGPSAIGSIVELNTYKRVGNFSKIIKKAKNSKSSNGFLRFLQKSYWTSKLAIAILADEGTKETLIPLVEIYENNESEAIRQFSSWCLQVFAIKNNYQDFSNIITALERDEITTFEEKELQSSQYLKADAYQYPLWTKLTSNLNYPVLFLLDILFPPLIIITIMFYIRQKQIENLLKERNEKALIEICHKRGLFHRNMAITALGDIGTAESLPILNEHTSSKYSKDVALQSIKAINKRLNLDDKFSFE
jgi:hypothetical protein